ncbi:MAG TPA: hypothetical protein VKT80_20070 [Chloroflexota bacterium]|nr:hypothetical protein [Chloroflexota bacterium]
MTFHPASTADIPIPTTNILVDGLGFSDSIASTRTSDASDAVEDVTSDRPVRGPRRSASILVCLLASTIATSRYSPNRE